MLWRSYCLGGRDDRRNRLAFLERMGFRVVAGFPDAFSKGAGHDTLTSIEMFRPFPELRPGANLLSPSCQPRNRSLSPTLFLPYMRFVALSAREVPVTSRVPQYGLAGLGGTGSSWVTGEPSCSGFCETRGLSKVGSQVCGETSGVLCI